MIMSKKKKRWTVDELTRLAFIHAEDDRRAMAEAQGDTEYGRECIELADAMHAYRLGRWGKTKLEREIEDAKLVSVFDLKKLAENDHGEEDN